MRRIALLVSACTALASSRPALAGPGELAALTADLPACEPARAHCLGIQLHVAIAEDHPIASPDWLALQLAAANRHFAALEVGFQVIGVDALPAGAARIATRRDRDELARGRLTGTAIHVFIVGQLDDLDDAGQVIRGVTWRLRDDGRKYVVVSTIAPDRVLAHELGHVFGLPHSTHPISIMNKTARDQPPLEQRTFADEEVAAMRPVLRRLLRAKLIAKVPK